MTDSEDMTAKDAFGIAKEEENDLVLRCTTAPGREVEYVAVNLEGAGSPIWIEHWKGEARSLTVEETTVRNTLNRCDPDFELVTEADSHVRADE